MPMLFATENLPYWIFLAAGTALFSFVILSGGGGDNDVDADLDADLNVDLDTDVDLDIDVDADLDIDADLDADMDLDADVGSANSIDAISNVNVGADSGADSGTDSGSSTLDILGWLGVGKAPIILLLALDLCLWGLLGWMANVMIGSVIRVIPTGIFGLPILLGSMAIALLLGGQIARPIGKIFASFGESASADRLIGCTGTVSSARLHKVSAGKIAQVDVLDPAKNLVTVNAVLPLWAKVQPKIGDKVFVIERSDQVYLYFVVAKDSEDESKWFSTFSKAQRSP
ncbi:MAG: DUF1449 domain-containing protein [Cyanobacteria bacterium P01_F01_bin.150]